MLTGGNGGMFLAPIPEPPGDPAALARAAGTYTSAHGEIQRSGATTTSVVGQVGGSGWTGMGAEGFVVSAESLSTAYGLTAGALARGAATLRTYAADLAAAKTAARQANAAVATANSDARALLTAQDAAEQKQADAADTAQTAATARTHALSNPHSPSAQTAADSAQQAASDAQSAATSAWGSVATLSGQWEASYGRAVALIGQAQTMERTASSKAAAGFDAATTELAGRSTHPARGGAHGVSGSNAWTTVIAEAATINDRGGYGLTAWGAFGVFTLGKAETTYIVKATQYVDASNDLGDSALALFERRVGYFGPNGFKAMNENLNQAWAARKQAVSELEEAVSPKEGFFDGVLGRAGLGVGMASDLVTEFAPSKSFGPGGMLGGNTDRLMAGLNFGASGLALGGSLGMDAAEAGIALVGGPELVGAVLIGTSAYFAGEFVYQHWHTIAHLGADAWHGIEDAGSWSLHTGESIVNDITNPSSWLP